MIASSNTAAIARAASAPRLAILGDYRVLSSLGEGGMGRVLLAEHRTDGGLVALKLLHAEHARRAGSVERLLREAQAAALIQHPGILKILGQGVQEDGAPFLVMEHLDGSSLGQHLHQRGGRLPLAEAVALGGQIADAMAAAHAAQVLHRDLKPGNVMLVRDAALPGGLRAKIVDFGIAKVVPSPALTRTGVLLGTARYMAPEQCLGRGDIDGKADVYALGVVLYELLAGRPPFLADSDVELLRMHTDEAPCPLGELRPQAPRELLTLVHDMLAKERAARPPMEEVRARLARLTLPPEGAAEPGPPARRGGTQTEDEEDEEDEEPCPFPGLMPFGEEDAGFFCGRAQEVKEVAEKLERAGDVRWLQIEGASGAGKSSLLQAGLLPRLRDDPARWQVAVLRPGRDPVGALQALLQERSAEPPLLLVVDQLEEVFTQADAQEALRFDAALCERLEGEGLWLCTTVRSDFLGRFHELPRLGGLLNRAQRYHLPPMGAAALREVVTRPAARAALTWEAGLVERLVTDATQTEGALPLLGHVLRELWLCRSGRRLTLASYERLGGVSGALSRSADALLAGMTPEGRLRARWLLTSLVRSGRGVMNTRRTLRRAEALQAAGGDALAESVLLQLSGGRDARGQVAVRLLQVSGEERVDLIHEALLLGWQTLRGYVDSDRKLLERRDDLEAAAQAWQAAGAPSGGLPLGDLLRYHEGTGLREEERQRYQGLASPLGRRFLAEAHEREEGREAEARLRVAQALRRQRRAIAVLSAVVVVVLGLFTFAYQQRRVAEARLRDALAVSGRITVLADRDKDPATRRALLEASSELLERLLRQTGDDSQVLYGQVLYHQARGALAWWYENSTLAYEEHAAAARIGERLVGREPGNREYRLALSKAYLGHARKAAERAEPWSTGNQALALAEGLLREDPDNNEYRLHLATVYHGMADVDRTRGRVDLLRKALALQEEAVRRGAPSTTRNSLAELHDKLGSALGAVGDLQSEEAEYRVALALREQLVAEEPTPHNRHELAGSHNYLGRRALRLGEPALARTYFLSSLAQVKAVSDSNPKNLWYRANLARTYLRLGEVEVRLADPAALATLAQASAGFSELLARDPKNPEYGVLRGRCEQLRAQAQAYARNEVSSREKRSIQR